MSALALRTFAWFAAAAILSCQLLAVHGLAGRPLHYDENEAMHASWLMAAGKVIYRDFFEDHPPHLALLLHAVLPEGDLLQTDVQLWTVRARWMSGFFGAVAAGAVMLFAFRMTRSPAAPIVAAATLLASSQIWARGLADIRAEAPTLALFWTGVVLLTWSNGLTVDRAVRAGAGIGLLFFAAVWNPKWPMESLLMGAVYLHALWTFRSRPRLLVAAIAPAVVIAAVALLPLVTVTTPRDFLFFNFQFKAQVVRDFTANAWIANFFERFPLWSTAAPQHHWVWIVGALALAIVSMRVWRPAEPRLAWIAIALCVSALVELRFVYPYPHLWAQYLVMVAMTASLVYAQLPAILESLAGRMAHGSRARLAVMVLMTVTATGYTMVALRAKALSAFRPPPSAWTEYWDAQRTMQTSLRPGETVWISPPRHPVAAFDASYYWYNFRESVPSAIRLHVKYPSFLPPGGFEELPPCAVAAGRRLAARNVRFVELGDWMPFLDGVCRCAEGAFQSGILTPTDSLGVFEVAAEREPSPRARAWLQRTSWLWPDLCRRQKIFLEGAQLNVSP